MKALIIIAIAATSVPAFAAGSSDDDGASRERRVCTQPAVRGGSRMTRRTCRTPAEWRERLGPDWRQHLAGASGLQDDYDAMQARMVAVNESIGPQSTPANQRGLGGGPN